MLNKKYTYQFNYEKKKSSNIIWGTNNEKAK